MPERSLPATESTPVVSIAHSTAITRIRTTAATAYLRSSSLPPSGMQAMRPRARPASIPRSLWHTGICDPFSMRHLASSWWQNRSPRA